MRSQGAHANRACLDAGHGVLDLPNPPGSCDPQVRTHGKFPRPLHAHSYRPPCSRGGIRLVIPSYLIEGQAKLARESLLRGSLGGPAATTDGEDEVVCPSRG